MRASVVVGMTGITPQNLTNKLGKEFRLTALDCFEDKRQTFCTAAWIENKSQIKWNWDCDLTVSKLNQRLEKDDGKLTNIRAYRTTLGGKLTTPALRYWLLLFSIIFPHF
jgi:hypothetical protein